MEQPSITRVATFELKLYEQSNILGRNWNMLSSLGVCVCCELGNVEKQYEEGFSVTSVTIPV
jgi:hypothetical protein